MITSEDVWKVALITGKYKNLLEKDVITILGKIPEKVTKENKKVVWRSVVDELIDEVIIK